MEAALRSVYKLATNQELENIDFVAIRGLQGVKEASVKILDKTFNVAVVSGLSNAKQLIDEILLGKRTYHFVEVMACPGGCIGGGGQPIITIRVTDLKDLWIAACLCMTWTKALN
jgi:NADP-reducing hydrogenase subunit HndD